MTATARTQAGSSRARWITFVVSSGALAAMTAGLMLPDIVTALLAEWGGVHFLHEAALVLLASMILVGLAAQLRRPAERPAAMLVTLAFPAVFVVAIPVTGFVFPPLLVMLALALVAAVAHPASGRVMRPSAPRTWLAIGLAAVWTVPALVYAAGQFALQRDGAPGDPHAEFGHWAGMGVLVLAVAVLAAVAAWRPAGWRVAGVTASVAAGLLGVASAAYPDLPSSLGSAWGAAAAVWAVVFLGVTVVASRPAERAEDDHERESHR